MNKYLQSIIDDYRINGGRYFQLPAGSHIVDEPIVINSGETLDLRGCTLVVPVGAGPAVYLNGIGARVCSGKLYAPSHAKYGIIIHGSLTSVEDIEINNFDEGLIVESGHGGLIYPNPADWVASDNVSLNGASVLDRCGSDGTPANFETSAGLVVMPGMPVTGPHQRVDASGLSQLQAGDPASLQGGVCDAASGMGPWVRSNADAQLAGMIPTDELRKRWAQWPEGWVALGTSDGRVSAAFPGPRAKVDGFWAPNALWRGGRIGLAGAVRESVDTECPSIRGIVGDFVRNTAPEPHFRDGRLVVIFGWLSTTQGWKAMISEVADV